MSKPQLYVEDPTHPVPLGEWMSPEVYEGVLSNCVIVCADVVIIDRTRRRINLARRRIKPMQGWFWIGALYGQKRLSAKTIGTQSITLWPDARPNDANKRYEYEHWTTTDRDKWGRTF